MYYNSMAKSILEALHDQNKLPPNKENLLATTLAGFLYLPYIN